MDDPIEAKPEQMKLPRLLQMKLPRLLDMKIRQLLLIGLFGAYSLCWSASPTPEQYDSILDLAAAGEMDKFKERLDGFLMLYPEDPTLLEMKKVYGQGQPEAPAPTQPPEAEALSPGNQLEIETVLRIYEQVAKISVEKIQREKATELLARKIPAQAKQSNHSAWLAFWSARASTALLIEDTRHAWMAGQELKRLGALESENAAVRDAMIALNVSGLLDEAHLDPNRLNDLLRFAAEEGYANGVATLLEAGADSKNGQTLLQEAALKGHAGMVTALIVGGADVNAKDKSGQTPLHGAIFSGNAGTVAALIVGGADLKADLNATSSSWRTKLFQAAHQGDLSMVATLIEAVPIEVGMDRSLDLGGGETLKLKWIAPGSFQMGDYSKHPVTLSEGYWLGQYEVTQGQWQALMGSAPSKFKGSRNPVEQVSWEDAMAFCRELTERERAAGRLPEGWHYTLPTEAQWEYACRAGTRTGFSFGDSDADLHRYGNYCDRSNTDGWDWQDKTHTDGHDKTAPVGSFHPNAWGLYDMHGNVWEWCSDWYGDYPSGSVVDPTGARSGSYRVYRGGSWLNHARYCRSAYRLWLTPGYRWYNLGFRLALSSVH